MGIKRKAKEDPNGVDISKSKKSKHDGPKGGKNERPKSAKSVRSDLIFPPRADWHAADLPHVDLKDVASAPSQKSVDELHKYAESLLEAEVAAYDANNKSASSSHKFMSTIMASGTLEDKVSALTLQVQESPLHAMKAFENLLGLSRKKSRNLALMALAAMKDLLGQGVLLPGDRKLRSFGKQPALLSSLQGKASNWRSGMPLPGALQKIHLVVFAYEDWLKRTYFEMLQVLENWCGDEVEYARTRALTYVYELLKDKPEQEENLLRLLVNKLGDTDRKIASRASYLLLQLENSHPAMKMVVTNSIEADCLYRPGQGLHAKYYAVITLNQTILSQKDEVVANRLLEVYFGLFVQLLKPTEKNSSNQKPQVNGKSQGGGGKAGKLAEKKRKAHERGEEADDQLREKMVAQVLTGVNRAFPFADTSDPTFEKSMDTIFRVTHSANFNTAVQALMLIQQISSTKHYGAERFYRTLYESLLDPRLCSSSKQVMYLNLLYKSLKADLNAKRVQAFVKRLLQTLTMHEPPFICGVLYLISELEGTFPSIRSMITEAEVDDEDEEEHFVDVPEDADGSAPVQAAAPKPGSGNRYDPRKRDPDHAHADRSCLWDVLPFVQHFHPSVSIFAEAILLNKAMPPKPDPTHYTLMHFLDRFVYRTARSKPSASMHGTSIMQPMAGSNAADLLVKPGAEGAASQYNTEAFWQRKIEDVAADEVFFHSYFNQSGNKKKAAPKKKDVKDVADDEDEEASDDAGEDEIWKAITASKPEVEGADEDDDLSLGDLESAYSASEDESEGGIDLGGEEGAEDAAPQDFSESEAGDEMPELESDEDAMFADDDDLPEDFEMPEAAEEGELSRNKKKRNERKKLKSLPTFASAEDYAKLLGGDDDDDM
ncbi:RNA-binding ribosome biosynthesis protein mak21 [Saxophila tyrrhenica]|uniref:RNA-binding ribosome biosynthesis protein mak21 n=1 Tax=Saxophila tyrrhenica TaxID=1690608 RepID=A0AAV9P735_9PEZI|nr:RNA-binding ribosome biosynthesis protein mak21 [Saxophila tyrrhenica]